MKFVRDIVHTALLGNLEELDAVRKLLTFDPSKGSYLSEENTLYTGLVDFCYDYLAKRYTVEIADTYAYTHPASIKDIRIPEDYLTMDEPGHKLRDYQIRAAKKSISKGRGIIEVATGGGKTEIAAVITKYLMTNGHAKKTFVIAETRFLMNQAADRFERRGLKGVSRFGGGHDFVPADIQVCVIDSVLNAIKDNDEQFMAEFNQCDLILFDEVHHLQSESWVIIGEFCKAKYRFGMTATVWSDPTEFRHSDFRLIGLTGKIVAHVPSIVLRNRGFLAEPYVTMIPVSEPMVYSRMWDDYYTAGIVRHPRRNSYIMSLAKSLYEGKYKTLIFVNYIQHGLRLVRLLVESGCKEAYFVKGGEQIWHWLPSGRWKCKRTSIELLASLVKDNEQVVIVGNTVMDEGIDIPSFNALIMGTAMKKYRRTVQRVGRGMRPKQGDNSVYIFDFVDAMHQGLLEHSEYRIESYQLEMYDMTGELATTSQRMKIPLTITDGLYSWAEERREKPHHRRRRSYRIDDE